MLGGERVTDGGAERLFETVVVRHGVGFAEREGGHAVAVHEGVEIGVAAEIAVGALRVDEIFQAVLHVVGVGTIAMGAAAALQGQDGQPGDGRIGFRAGASALVSLH